VVNARNGICEADDGQKFPCGQPTPAPRTGTAPAPGNGTAPAPGTGTAPAPGTGTAPAPGTGTAPAPGNGTPPVNRAIGWEAKKENTSLYDEQAGANTQKGSYSVVYDPDASVSSNEQDRYKVYETTGGTFQSQAEAFTAHNNVIIGCTGTNINGRTDNLCTVTPNHPECTGLNLTLQHAVFCNNPPPPGSPPGTPCASFGAYGYNIDEWLVFGQHYYNSMSGCINVKDAVDPESKDGSTKGARASRMVALTDIASFPGATPGNLKDGSAASTITGETKVVTAETRAKEMMERFDDGAAYLGFNKGELILRAYKGESFITAFSDSPFAEKLTKSLRETVDYALGNPTEPMEKAKENRVAELEKKKQEAESRGETLEAEGARSLASSERAAGGPVASTGGDSSVGGTSRGASASLHAYGQGSASGAGYGSSSGSNSAQINSLRQDGLLGKAVLSGGPVSYGDQPPSPAAGSAATGAQAGLAAEANEASLFQRVKVSYRRYAPQMRAYGESKAARDVRLTDTPEFFRDL
jgi:hypothetical protein